MSAPDLTPDSPTKGLLLDAFEGGHTDALAWSEVTVDGVVVTVASDAMKAPLLDRVGVRLPVSYEESIVICRALGCVAPTRAIADAMFAQARAQLGYVGLVVTDADEKRMRTVAFTLRFHDRVEKQLAGRDLAPTDLRFGAWKLWLLHAALADRGAVNYGFWDLSKKPPAPVQTVGSRHDAKHYDYSQLLQPVKRMARLAASGEAVDLLDAFALKDRVPREFLDAFRT